MPVDGIQLVIDFDFVKEMQHKLGRFPNGPTDFFPAISSVLLNQDNRDFFVTGWTLNVVAPNPEGTDYFLYVDSVRDVYLENQTQNFFQMSRDKAIQLLSPDRRALKDTLLDGYFVRRLNTVSGDEAAANQGRLTFIIQDAIRCDGTDLTRFGILERIAFIEVFQFKFSGLLFLLNLYLIE